MIELLTLLIRIPTVITWGITALELYIASFPNSKRISVKKFFKIRRYLGIARWVINLTAIVLAIYLKVPAIAGMIAVLMLWCAIMDVIFYIMEKNINKK